MIQNSFLIFIFMISSFFLSLGCSDDLEIRQYKMPKKQTQNKKQSKISWETPTGWFQKVAGSFRIASFRIPSKSGKADGSIIELAGNGGGLLANINRWRGQIKLESMGMSELLLITNKGNGKTGSFTWYRLVNKNNKSSAILGAVFVAKKKTVFVKLKGPLETLDAHQDNFLKLCQSVQVGK